MDVSFLNILIISEKKVQFYDLKKILELEFNLKIDIKSSYHDLDQSKTQLSFYIIDLIGNSVDEANTWSTLVNGSWLISELTSSYNLETGKPLENLLPLTKSVR